MAVEGGVAGGPSLRAERLCWMGGAMVVFGAALWLFHTIFFTPIFTDLQEHAYDVVRWGNGELDLPANFLYYVTIYLLSGLRADWTPLFWAGSVALAVATAARFALDFRILRAAVVADARTLEPVLEPVPVDPVHSVASLHPVAPGHPVTSGRPARILWIALALTVSFSLPTLAAFDGRWYLGQTPPNVWHNSTTIFVMPLAIALFWAAARNLEHPRARQDAAIAVLAVLNVATKPSFFLAFAPSYTLLVLLANGLRRDFWIRLWPVAVGALAVLVQYYMIFSMQQANRYQGASSVTIEPFGVWSHYSPSIPLSLLASTLFPLVSLVAYRRALREPAIRLALVLYLTGIAMMALLAESGPRRTHGNFFWQTYLCSHVLFLATAIPLARELCAGKTGLREWIALAALALQVVAGIAYLVRMLATGEIF